MPLLKLDGFDDNNLFYDLILLIFYSLFLLNTLCF